MAALRAHIQSAAQNPGAESVAHCHYEHGRVASCRHWEIPTNSCVPSFVDDEEIEAFQRVEQFREFDFEPMIAPQLLTEKHRRQDAPAPFGVGLKMSSPLSIGGGKTQQPQDERSRCSEEQQSFEALGALHSRVTQREPQSVAFEVANGLLDQHTLCVDSLDPGTGSAVMRQRSGEQPRGLVHPTILRATSSALATSVRSTAKGTHQIQPAPVPVAAQQTLDADVAHARRGLSVQRMDEAPATRFRPHVLDVMSNPPDAVSSRGFDIAKPRPAESRIGHHDGPGALGQDGLRPMQESPVDPGIVEAVHRMHYFVE